VQHPELAADPGGRIGLEESLIILPSEIMAGVSQDVLNHDRWRSSTKSGEARPVSLVCEQHEKKRNRLPMTISRVSHFSEIPAVPVGNLV